MAFFPMDTDADWSLATEAECDPNWLDADFLAGAEAAASFMRDSSVTAYALDGRYVYEAIHWSGGIWRGVDKHPAKVTFDILSELQSAGLPVVRPLAAMVKRKRVLQSEGALIWYQLAEGKTLPAALEDDPLAETSWQQLGAFIRQLHDLKISLGDLDGRDFVLLSNGKLFLNKVCGLHRKTDSHPAWTQLELQSLLTSLIEAREAGEARHFKDSNWLALTAAYIHRARPVAE